MVRRSRRRYHPPATPYQRLLADPRTSEDGAAPGESHIRRAGSGSVAAANPHGATATCRDRRPSGCGRSDGADRADAGAVPLWPAHGVAGRRGASDQPAEGEGQAGRRRPDPFVTVTAQLRSWFEAEPWRTSRELFERLQEEQPGVYPDGQLRTLQRRLKVWRREMAHEMVFGGQPGGATNRPAPVSDSA